MFIKKYYTIGEVAKLLDIELYKLRSIDKKVGRNLLKIKNRRYYTLQNIEQIKSLLPSLKEQNILKTNISLSDNSNTLKTGIQLSLPFEKPNIKSATTTPKQKDVQPLPITTDILHSKKQDDALLQKIDLLIKEFSNLKVKLQSFTVL